MKEPFKDEHEAGTTFDRWKELFTKGRNSTLTPEERKEIRILSKKLGQWFNPT
jgi:hypothetical protein